MVIKTIQQFDACLNTGDGMSDSTEESEESPQEFEKYPGAGRWDNLPGDIEITKRAGESILKGEVETRWHGDVHDIQVTSVPDSDYNSPMSEASFLSSPPPPLLFLLRWAVVRWAVVRCAGVPVCR